MTRLYPSMALNNIRSNRKTFIPYMISCILTISIFYIICSLGANENIAKIWGGNIIQSYMSFGQGIVSIFALIFLFYVNSFLIKRRAGEFGLYNILGMEKKHISKVVFFETLYSFVISMVIGLSFGILLDKLMYLLIVNVFDGDIILGFYISGSAIFKSLVLFGLIFFFIFLNSIRYILKSKPVDLMKSSKAGEREPKSRWILAVLGIICLVSGYTIAIMTQNPVAAVAMFFVAVLLVIAGTYLLFTAGSIVFLKLLRKKKSYYYKTNHFISISGMIYRMKQNAVGLANICVLSTMVIVMLSATLSMFLGLDDSLNKRYPREICMDAACGDNSFDTAVETMEEVFAEKGLTFTNVNSFRDLSFSSVYNKKTDTFDTDPSEYQDFTVIGAVNNLNSLVFVPLEDYNHCMGTDETLEGNEILVYSNRTALNTSYVRVFDENFHVKKRLDDFMDNGNAAANITSSHFIVVKDMDIMNRLLEKQADTYGQYKSYMQAHFMADVFPSDEKAVTEAFEEGKNQILNDSAAADSSLIMTCRTIESKTFGIDFSGLFFIGIFLGLLFIMATVLIMYYKQITEGYEDKERFEIMQNVGMSHREVRKTINSQVLTVFFLPLVTAGIHTAFAFPFIFRILTLMNLFNLKLYTVCTIGCFLVFAIFYAIVYVLTSKLYYGIVKK